jgi:hypothetical protein
MRRGLLAAAAVVVVSVGACTLFNPLTEFGGGGAAPTDPGLPNRADAASEGAVTAIPTEPPTGTGDAGTVTACDAAACDASAAPPGPDGGPDGGSNDGSVDAAVEQVITVGPTDCDNGHCKGGYGGTKDLTFLPTANQQCIGHGYARAEDFTIGGQPGGRFCVFASGAYVCDNSCTGCSVMTTITCASP